MKKYLIPKDGTFYKANLHSHSTVSDGMLSPAEIKQHYMAHGYSVVAYTDHDVMIPHDDLASDDFLPLHGYEMEINEGPVTQSSHYRSCHICLIALEPDNLKQVCWHRNDYCTCGAASEYADKVDFYENEPDYIRYYTPECISDMMKRGRDHGFFVTYNHPAWSLENYENYIHYHNMHAMEICNYGSVTVGFPDYNPAIYDDMLRSGKKIFCIATDDNHNFRGIEGPYGDSFGGFTMIKADNLEYRTITKALEDGHFYASQGPQIHQLWVEDGTLHIHCSPAQRIDFMFGTRRASACIADPGDTITSATCPLPWDGVYVRVTVTDCEGKHANTNAYFLNEILDQ